MIKLTNLLNEIINEALPISKAKELYFIQKSDKVVQYQDKIFNELNEENERIVKSLEDLEDANQKIFDEKVIAVLTAFLGVVFTFRDKLSVNTWTVLQKLLCASMIAWITISITIVVYSYYYGAVIARKYNKQIHDMLNEKFDVSDAMKTMECMNSINCFNFILTNSLPF